MSRNRAPLARLGALRIGVIVVMMLSVVLMAVVGCSTGPGVVLVEVDVVDGFFSNPVLMNDGTVFYLRYSSGNSDGPDSIGRLDSAGKESTVDLPDLGLDNCSVLNVSSLRSLPDGRLGLVARCPDVASAVGVSGASTSLELDPASGKIVRLGAAHGSRDVLWMPGMKEAWASQADPGCDSIAPMDANALLPVPSYVPHDLLPWALDSGFHENVSSCLADGRVGYLGLSDTGVLFFLGSPDSRGVSPDQGGVRRADIGWNLYGLDLASGLLRKVADGFYRPQGLAVVAGGKQVVVSAAHAGESGLWSVDAASGSLSPLDKGEYSGVTASGHDRVIVAERRDGASEQIVRLSIP